MTHVEWQFGGWLHALPAWQAASMLIVLAIVGTIYIGWSYRRTLNELPPVARNALTVVRAAVVLLLLICLANPVRVEDESPPKPSQRPLAVLVDRSSSMSTPDYRGLTRLSSAVRLWKSRQADAARSFPKITFHRFAADVQSARSFDDAAKAKGSGGETHLFAALRKVLETDPAAIACLTDGLDTTADDAGKLAAEAIRRGIPIYFAPGENHLQSGTSLALREIKAPARVLRRTQFPTTALVELVTNRKQELPMELWSGKRKLAAVRWPVHTGRNTISWPVAVDSGEPGPLSLEFRVGEKPVQSASCVVEVVENTTLEVLYYQGALQWGYRFLRGALESDPSFRLTAILNPALHVRITTGAAGDSSLTDLPEDARELKRFNIVVLAHVFADLLSAKQQQALVEYVRGGGGVLFISPDSDATARFSGTALEEMLPVVFAARSATENPALQRFRLQTGSSSYRLAKPSNFSRSAKARTAWALSLSAQNPPPVQLKPFSLPPNARPSAISTLFNGANSQSVPKYVENAKVSALKPGAELLAVSRPMAGGAPEVLLAREQFGSGFTAALTTDLLWRWKLSLPSTSHAVERFWQQLLLSLAPASSGQGLRIIMLTATPAVKLPIVFRISAGTSEAPPKVESVSPTGERARLTVREEKSPEGRAWNVSFTPTSVGNWKVAATDSAGRSAHVVFPVAEKAGALDLANLPADLSGMRTLAESTGGALIDKTTVFRPLAQSAGKPHVKRVKPIWNNGWLLGLLLAAYGTELVVRRMLRML